MDAGRDAPVASPCVYVCALDDDDICLGCQRSGEEITRWTHYTDAERQHFMDVELPQRAADRER